MDDRKCLKCNTELEQTYIGRYECKCGATYYESDFVENEGLLNKPSIISAIEEMEQLNKTNGDVEYTHGEADKILCTVLKELGLVKLVEAWEKVEKWYA